MTTQVQASLSAHLVTFCRYSRCNGLPITPQEESDALWALTLISLQDPNKVRVVLRAVLAKSHAEQLRFDILYQKFWAQQSPAGSEERKGNKNGRQQDISKLSAARAVTTSTPGNRRDSNFSEQIVEFSAYSPMEIYRTKDFSAFKDDELHAIMKLIAMLARSMSTRFSRRFKPSNRRKNLDLKRTMRLSMRRGGEVLDLAYRSRKISKLNLVVLCDVSKSMDLYTQFLLQFLYGFQNIYHRIESFVFSTSLHRISEHLIRWDYRTTLQHLSQKIPDWSGGTKIGESLRAFVDQHHFLLDSKTIVIIMSDGWDTGDIYLLKKCMKQIHERAGRVLWLNPLAGQEDYQPTVRGIRAALPFVDIFASMHNLESLKELATHLGHAQNRLNRKKRQLGHH